MKKYWALAFTTLALSLTLVACGGQTTETKPTESTGKKQQEQQVELPQTAEVKEPTNYVRVDMKEGGSMVFELYPAAAPITVKNFQKLVAEGFYNGLTFHRAVPNFVIQGGDPDGNGMGGSRDKIQGEFLANGIFNPIKHVRGTLSMARAMDNNSASSQFFIVLSPAASSSLNDRYAAFGQVIYGMKTVDQIAALPTQSETIVEKPVMEKVYFISEADAQKLKALEPAEAQSK